MHSYYWQFLSSSLEQEAGDKATRPQTVSQQVAAGNLAVEGRAPWKRQVGLETSPWPGTHRAGWEDAGRDAKPGSTGRKGFLSSEAGTHWWPVLGLLASSRCQPPHPPAAPSPHCGLVGFSGITGEAGDLHVSESCLLYWAGLAFICLTSLETLKSWESCLW